MKHEDEFSLSEVPLSEVPFGDLTEPGLARDGYFGGSKRDGIDYRRINISMGSRPLCWRLTTLFKKAGKVLPENLRLHENHDIWMIAHAVSVADRGPFAGMLGALVDAVGYEADFPRSLVSTIDLLPEAAMVKTKSGGFEVEADVGLEGAVSLAVPEMVGAIMSGLGLPLPGGGKLSFSTSVDFKARLNFNVWTPKIKAWGQCDNNCEWLFHRVDQPLLNTQVMFQTVLVSKEVDELHFKCRSYAWIRSVNFIPLPSRFETKWMNVSTRPIAEL